MRASQAESLSHTGLSGECARGGVAGGRPGREGPLFLAPVGISHCSEVELEIVDVPDRT